MRNVALAVVYQRSVCKLPGIEPRLSPSSAISLRRVPGWTRRRLVASTNYAKERFAIQGERGSNSHMAALEMLGDIEIVPCNLSAEVVEAVLRGRVDGAVLPIENSLHGSVAEHYDLLLEQPVRIDRESLLRIRHNLIAAPGVRSEEIRRVLSHPVALSQCRRFLAAFTQAQAMPFYDTAGSVKYLMAEGLRDTAGISPELAAREYGAEVLVAGIEDHTENYTRFHLLRRADAPHPHDLPQPDKLSVAFTVEHRPGTLVAALEQFRDAGVDLTKIESRPVPGKPWEYVFYVDFRFAGEATANNAVRLLAPHCRMVKELGRYAAATPVKRASS
jgi:prephenate dehydratase